MVETFHDTHAQWVPLILHNYYRRRRPYNSHNTFFRHVPHFGEEVSRPLWLLHPVSKLKWRMVAQHNFDSTNGWVIIILLLYFSLFLCLPWTHPQRWTSNLLVWWKHDLGSPFRRWLYQDLSNDLNNLLTLLQLKNLSTTNKDIWQWKLK